MRPALKEEAESQSESYTIACATRVDSCGTGGLRRKYSLGDITLTIQAMRKVLSESVAIKRMILYESV